MTDTDRRMRELLAPTPQDTRVDPALTGTVIARARRRTRRRRTAVALALPVLAAALAAGVIAVTTQETTSNRPPAVQHPDRPHHDGSDGDGSTRSLSDWLEQPPESLFAGPGTAMYRTCDGDDCRVRLLAPSGEEFDLAGLRPDVAADLEDTGLEQVSISPHGTLLAYPGDDGGYEVRDLADPARDVEVPLPVDGDEWRFVSWDDYYATPVLGLFDGERIVRYAHWHWRQGLTDRPLYTQVPPDVTTVPTSGSTSDSPTEVAAVPDGSGWPSTDDRVASTTPPTGEWMVLGGEASSGRIVERAGQSFESCVGPTETLVGGDGYPRRWTIGGTIPSQVDRLIGSTAIYDHAVSEVEPVALAVYGCERIPPEDRWEPNSPPGGRVDLPTGDDPDRWTFLGVLPNGEAALIDTAGDECAYVRMDRHGGLHRMHDIPEGAETIIPGGVPSA